MKEVIIYLERLRANIDTIWDMRKQHSFMITELEKHGNFTDQRMKQFKITNNKVSEIIIVDKFFDSKCNHEWFDTHEHNNQIYQQCYWCDGTRKKAKT